MTAARFVTFEGGEGAGKSTQVKLLVRALRHGGIEARSTFEPGGAPGAEAIRALLVNGEIDRWSPMSEVLLHYAARVEHLERLVKPALARGQWVLCDRFADSTLAYQGYGAGVEGERIDKIRQLVLGRFAPDLTFVLDLPVAEGMARLARRDGEDSRYERMSRDFHERVRQGYLEIAAREPERCVLLESGGATPEAIHARICEILCRRLGVRIDPVGGQGE
jgi:dTMP kinase